MEQLLQYLLKSSGLIAVFYLAYHFLVRKETFFNSNRWFLLIGLFTSLLLPLYFIKKIVWIERPTFPVRDFVINSPQTIQPIQNVPVAEAFDWMQFIWISYAIIVSILVVKIVFNLVSLYRMLYQQQIIKKEQFKLVNLNKDIAPFSFFNYIVYNSDLYSNEELQSILLHEQIHSKQKHSADVLLAELFCSLFWFNPFVWLYKKAITQNLEYIADQKAIEQLEDKKSYQHALLKVVSNQNCLPITNNFYQSLIKKRIVMLNKNQSQKTNSWKYAMIIPALISFVFLFQVKVIAKDKFITPNIPVLSVETPIVATTSEQTVAVQTTARGEGNYVFDKILTDQNLKDDAADISEAHNIKFVISNVKRNSNGEIIAIKMTFDDKNGNKGKTEQYRTIPIRPIFFQIKEKYGKSVMGFYDNPDMVVKPVDPINENKIVTVESIKDDAIIYVDGNRYTKADLNELDPKGLEKIEILTDAASLLQYAAKEKGSVVVVTTNWPARQESKPHPVNIVTIANGDEVTVYDRFNMKVPGYPAVQFTENSPVLIINGVQKSNPRLILESMNFSKIKDIQVLNDSGKDVKGAPIAKVIITLK